MELYLKKFFKLFTVCSSFLLTTCAAYDLGKDGTTYYKIDDPENATWDQVSFIVKDKCATCHTDEKPWYKPENTNNRPNAENPNFGLNNLALKEFWDSKNLELTNVKKCIEKVGDKEPECGLELIPMPPKYATPLDENERTALVSFTKRLLEQQAKDNPSSLSESYQNNCKGCHGAKGEGGGFPKIAGTTLSLDAFKQIIQNGRGGMSAQPLYDINKAESDLAELKKL
jgi:hypothetical protein